MRAAVVAVVAALVLPVAASGFPQVRRAERVAAKTWPVAARVCPRVSVTWTDLTVAAGTGYDYDLWGLAQRRSFCSVELDRSIRGVWSATCSTVVHEYGHLAGVPHSDDPTSLMYPFIRFAPQCGRRGRPFLRES